MDEDRRAYAEVLFEKLGKERSFHGNLFTEWGTRLESLAMEMMKRDWPHLRIEQPGFIEHATDPRVGISPDGLAMDSVTGDVYLIEIKCPFVRGIGDGIKEEYKSQVQLSMSVLRSHGVDSRCLFMQYNPHPSEQATYEIVDRCPSWERKFFENLERFWNDLETWRGRPRLDHPLFATWLLNKDKRSKPLWISKAMESKFFKHVIY
jgi:hypothetical protein